MWWSTSNAPSAWPPRRPPPGPRSPRCLNIARQPEPGEDLPPDRVVPVAERAATGHRVHPERAAAQHLVVPSEEHLRVLPIWEVAKPRIPLEVRRGPFPHVADQLMH